MTHKEICEDIVENGTCWNNTDYSCGDCPFDSVDCDGMFDLAKQWLEEEHKEVSVDKLDKQAAMKRLDAIEREAKELRAIIEKSSLVYNDTKIYIGVKDGEPYIMAGNESRNYFQFHCFAHRYKSEHGWTFPKDTGQECLDYHLNDGFEIREFDNTKKAFEYFMSFL